jgi:hypothetical protein
VRLPERGTLLLSLQRSSPQALLQIVKQGADLRVLWFECGQLLCVRFPVAGFISHQPRSVAFTQASRPIRALSDLLAHMRSAGCIGQCPKFARRPDVDA